MGMLVVNKIDG